MRTSHTLVFGLLTAVVLAGGCSSSKLDDAALLREESSNLRVQLADRNDALEAANADRRELAMQNEEFRRQLDEANTRLGDLSGRTTGFEGISGVTSNYGNGEVTVSISSDVLFDSGKATLKAAAKRSLSQVASVLKSQYPGKDVRIAGYTDTDPIKKSGWTSNFHLGSERAYAVMEHLRENGVKTKRMHIASFGPNRALATKAASRRVEITVLLN